MRDHELLDLERDIDRGPGVLEDATRPRPPLRLVRESEPRPPVLLLPVPARRAEPWWNGVAFGFALVAMLLGGAIALAVGMGWVRVGP